jgi:hypothetical protein
VITDMHHHTQVTTAFKYFGLQFWKTKSQVEPRLPWRQFLLSGAAAGHQWAREMMLKQHCECGKAGRDKQGLLACLCPGEAEVITWPYGKEEQSEDWMDGV